jgi:hypothetical protein
MTYFDFNSASEQTSFDLIPKGTLVRVRMTVKPGGFDDASQGWTGGYATRNDNTGSVSVKDRDLTAPPASPVNGDRYLVPAAATGAWVGKTNQIAARIADVWEFHVPKIGWLCYIEDEAKLSAFKATGWSAGIAI